MDTRQLNVKNFNRNHNKFTFLDLGPYLGVVQVGQVWGGVHMGPHQSSDEADGGRRGTLLRTLRLGRQPAPATFQTVCSYNCKWQDVDTFKDLHTMSLACFFVH